MDYKKIYDSIIARRQTEIPVGYIEKHHILPRSLGGSDEAGNLVSLTAREHFICHYLLAKMFERETFEWYKMNNAFMFMKAKSYAQMRYMNSKLYESLKKNFSKVMSENQTGKKNSQYGNRWIHNDTLQLNKKIKKDQEIPLHWKPGRVMNWNGSTEYLTSCAYCNIDFRRIGKGSKFCSDKCKLYCKSPAIKLIDDNIDELIAHFKTSNSLTQTLNSVGITGRKGNKYFSKKVKDLGLTVLGRRNSS